MSVCSIPEDRVSFDGPRDDSLVCYFNAETDRWVAGYRERGSTDREDCLTEAEAVDWFMDNWYRYFHRVGCFGGRHRAFDRIDPSGMTIPRRSVIAIPQVRNMAVIPVRVRWHRAGNWSGLEDRLYVARKRLRARRYVPSKWFSSRGGEVLVTEVYPYALIEVEKLKKVDS